MRMNQHEAWKNFKLGEELSISGTFIYQGLRRFFEMQVLDNADELFEVFYNLSAGLERLLKIAVVFVEQTDGLDQDQLEESLITHNHLDLLNRVLKHAALNFGSPHKEFLAILSKFYKSIRYGRFTLSSVFDPDQERRALCGFLGKHLKVELKEPTGLFSTRNEHRYRKFIRGVVVKISGTLFELIRKKAHEVNLYTYELRRGSRAETVFLGGAELSTESVLWKELLIFFMNTNGSSGYIEFLRSIEALDFDPELVSDYLACFQSDTSKAMVVGELEQLYDDLKDPGERLKTMDLIGNPNVMFDSEEIEDE